MKSFRESLPTQDLNFAGYIELRDWFLKSIELNFSEMQVTTAMFFIRKTNVGLQITDWKFFADFSEYLNYYMYEKRPEEFFMSFLRRDHLLRIGFNMPTHWSKILIVEGQKEFKWKYIDKTSKKVDPIDPELLRGFFRDIRAELMKLSKAS